MTGTNENNLGLVFAMADCFAHDMKPADRAEAKGQIEAARAELAALRNPPYVPETVEQIADRIVRNDVCYCVSSLIHGLACLAGELSPAQSQNLGVDFDDLLTLGSRAPDSDDYENAADGIRVVKAEDGSFRWEVFERVADRSIGGREMREEITDSSGDDFETALEAWRDAFDHNGVDHPNGSEAFEHWVVSDWLAEKLREHGETVVDDVAGLTVWARCTTGQAIKMDYVIEQIAREIHAR